VNLWGFLKRLKRDEGSEGVKEEAKG